MTVSPPAMLGCDMSTYQKQTFVSLQLYGKILAKLSALQLLAHMLTDDSSSYW